MTLDPAVLDETRAEITEALANLVHASRREMPVVGTALAPTPWDKRHEQMNALLDELEASAHN